MSDTRALSAASFETWKRRVNNLMTEMFAIDTADAGLDQNELRNYWEHEPSPDAFVIWFGEKYDLYHIVNWGWSGVKLKA